MEEFEEDFFFKDLEEDMDKDAEIFLTKSTFMHWYHWAIGGSLYKNIWEVDEKVVSVQELTVGQICDRIHEGRMDLVNGVNKLISYHLEEENYELIPKLKEHCEKLHKEGLELEMKVERFL